MKLLQLRYFIYVAKLGSFTVASRHLSVAQSALSRQIRSLELEIGEKLLDRNTHFVRPTPLGLRLLQIAIPILEEIDRIPEKLRETEKDPAGHVTVGMLPSIAGYITPSLLRHAAEKIPNVQIQVVEGLSSVLREGLRLGNLDTAVLTAGMSNREFYETPILDEEMVLTGHEYLLNNIADPTDLASLVDVPLISTEGFKEVVYNAARASGVLLRFDMMQNSLAALKAMLIQKFGVSILPLTVVHEETMDRRLAIRRIASPGLFRRLAITHLDGKRPSRSVVATEELITSELLSGIGTRRL